jgi:hypothetical protein
MKFALASEHRDFFAKNSFVEFEGLLSLEEVENLKTHIDAVLAKRLKTTDLERKSAQELFLAGRDLWREDPVIKKQVTSPRLAEITSSLFKKRPLRLGYDQSWRTGAVTGPPFLENFTLQQISCLQTITGGVLLQLSSSPQTSFPLSHKPGSAVFLGPKFILDFSTLFQTPHLHLLLIVYCGENTFYSCEKKDPNTHALKKLGYVFGDLLRNDRHPLFRF